MLEKFSEVPRTKILYTKQAVLQVENSQLIQQHQELFEEKRLSFVLSKN